MSLKKFVYRRKPLRLRGYDYSKTGFYFVTICTKDRECLFGGVVDKKMRINEFGKIITQEWFRTPFIRKNIALDAFVVMPNHIHGIIIIKYKIKSCTGVLQYARTPDARTPDKYKKLHEGKRCLSSPSGNLGAMIRGFKGVTTVRINKNRQGFGRSPVWHRNYYERIIRSPKELKNIRQYIINNPANWSQDKENPINN